MTEILRGGNSWQGFSRTVSIRDSSTMGTSGTFHSLLALILLGAFLLPGAWIVQTIAEKRKIRINGEKDGLIFVLLAFGISCILLVLILNILQAIFKS